MCIKRALLIENHPVLRKSLQHLLSSLGLELMDEPIDLVEGVLIAASQQPSFVILDTSITEVNGLTFSELIRGLAPLSKVILLVDDPREYSGLAAERGATCIRKGSLIRELTLLMQTSQV
jgi:two-component system response regulator EvgA